jgi:hypothetical protein
VPVDRQNRTVRESRDTTGPDEAGETGLRCRPTALRPVAVYDLPEGVRAQWELPAAISARTAGPVPWFPRFGPARLAFCPDGGFLCVLSGTVDSAVPAIPAEPGRSRRQRFLVPFT